MSAALVALHRLAGYEPAAVARAIDALLRLDPELVRFLGQADPRRLVVVKPNWVQESHELQPDVWEPLITHPTVLLAVVGGLAELMQGVGTIAVCDAPHTYASFDAIARRGGLDQSLALLRARFPALSVELIDLRRETWRRKEEVVVERLPNPLDPRGYARLDLGRDSAFFGHRGEGRYYGADYDQTVVNQHHRGELQEYLLAGTPMSCDLFVNLPKLKTHKKTGVTCCLKNLVGINGDKNWLPHHTEGSAADGGDEFPEPHLANALERRLKHAGRRLALAVPGLGTWTYRKMRNVGKRVLGDSETAVRNGNWHGNDTCWRMCLDLNRALLHGNLDGTWRQDGPRRYLAIVDGIVGGQGNGPLCPDPAPSGVLFAGSDPAVVDAVACRLMGYDPRAVPVVANAFMAHRWPITRTRIEEIRVREAELADTPLTALVPAISGGFRPHFGWALLGESR